MYADKRAAIDLHQAHGTARRFTGEPADVLARACRGELSPPAGRTGRRPEQRRRPRLRFDCPIRWSTGGVDRFGEARDVSEIGAGFTVRTLNRPAVGQNITLVFELDDEYEWVVDDRATVARCDERGDGLWDVGVQLRLLDV